MAQHCGTKVEVGTRHDGTPIERDCGSYWDSEMVLCDTCQAKYEHKYPQGWRYYPGDVCKHGVYVGGCGADIMCGECESGR
jgi:hypothetical protein